MATIYVANNADSGDGTFRAAYQSASSGDTILPDPNVDWGDEATIYLTSPISSTSGDTKALTIGSRSSPKFVFDGQDRVFTTPVFYFKGDGPQTFSNIGFKRIRCSAGAGACVRVGNGQIDATFDGVSWINCANVSTNTSAGYGAAIYAATLSEGSLMKIVNCVAFGNSAQKGSFLAFGLAADRTKTENTFVSNTIQNETLWIALTSDFVNSLTGSGDPGFVCYDETCSDALDLHLLDAGASVLSEHIGTAEFRVRLGYPDGTFADSTVSAEGTPDASFATNGNIALTWTRPADADADRVAVEYSLDGYEWNRRAILLDDGDLSGATLCFNSPYRTAGTTRSEDDEELDADGLPRPTTGFSLGAYETIDADRFLVNGRWSYSRFFSLSASAPDSVCDVWLCGTATIDDEIDASTLTLAPGAVVTLAADAGVGTLDVGPRARLTVEATLDATTATLGADARLLGDGYFSAGTFDREDGIVADTLRWRDGEATVTGASVGNGRVEWTKTGDGTVVVERRSGDAWELVCADVSGSYVLTPTPAGSAFRVWDGNAFVTASAPSRIASTYRVKCWSVVNADSYSTSPAWTAYAWAISPELED